MTYGKFLRYAQWNKSSLNVPILEHQRKGSDNGLSSRKNFLEYSILCRQTHFAQKNEDCP